MTPTLLLTVTLVVGEVIDVSLTPALTVVTSRSVGEFVDFGLDLFLVGAAVVSDFRRLEGHEALDADLQVDRHVANKCFVKT